MARVKIPDELSAYFSALGKKGGKKSLKTMTPEERRERARIAAAKSAEVRSKKAAAKKRASGKAKA